MTVRLSTAQRMSCSFWRAIVNPLQHPTGFRTLYPSLFGLLERLGEERSLLEKGAPLLPSVK